MYRTSVQSVFMGSGESVSSFVDLRGTTRFAIVAPALTSCQVFLQGTGEIPAPGADPTSASFSRAFDGTSHWWWGSGVGSNCIAVVEQMVAFPAVRIETGVAQGSDRVFTVVKKDR